MNLRAELKRLQAIAVERTRKYPGGWWAWIPCPDGSNLGYYKKNGREEYATEVPRGGRAVKTQYADGVARLDRIEGEDTEGDLAQPTKDDAIYCAANVPQQILDELSLTREALTSVLLFQIEAHASDEDSSDLLAKGIADWADLDERRRSRLVWQLDMDRGRPPQPAKAKPESESVVDHGKTFIEKAIPSAIEMVKKVIEKREPEPTQYEGIPEHIVQSPDRLEIHLRNQREAERRKQREEKPSQKNVAAQAWESDRGWRGI